MNKNLISFAVTVGGVVAGMYLYKTFLGGKSNAYGAWREGDYS